MKVALVGGEPAVARDLAAQLATAGAEVVTVGDGPAGDGHLGCDPAVAAQVYDGLVAAQSRLGATPAVVRLGVRAAQTTAGALATLSLDDWIARAETPLREAFAFHQAAQRFLADRGGRIVAILPTVGLSGGNGFVPWATVAEADRSLVKAQARVSGRVGVTVNCVVVASLLLAESGDDPDRSGLPAYALAPPDFAQLAAVVLGLLGPAFNGVTGQTIAVDGGRWMAP
jgi:3-oxoacyl-[acyl-carrier protein] reductase